MHLRNSISINSITMIIKINIQEYRMYMINNIDVDVPSMGQLSEGLRCELNEVTIENEISQITRSRISLN